MYCWLNIFVRAYSHSSRPSSMAHRAERLAGRKPEITLTSTAFMLSFLVLVSMLIYVFMRFSNNVWLLQDFVDPGATCTSHTPNDNNLGDQISSRITFASVTDSNGVSSHADTINLDFPGEYTITYQCK